MEAIQSIDLRRVVFSLSDALDLVGVDDLLHGKRVAMMAAQVAAHLGEGRAQVAQIYDAGLLHDCGVSSTKVRRCLIDHMEWPGSHLHCEFGESLLRGCRLLRPLAELVRLHHTRHDAPTPIDVPAHVRRLGNLLFLVDRVDALAGATYADRSTLHESPAIRARVAASAGTLFDPELVAAFLDVSAPAAFWLQLDTNDVHRDVRERLREPELREVRYEDLHELALLFARIVDAKSPFTKEHSLGVGRLARSLGVRAGLSPESCGRLELAGLLHDIGKLRIPDEILEKPGSLTEGERDVMVSHSFETYQILRYTPGLDRVAQLAAYHHERLNGRGYPFQRPGAAITLEMRILQVADVFQALAQQRPYRAPLLVSDVLGELRRMVTDGSLDADVVALIEASPDECYRVATVEAPP